ncbi:MAG: hypothetical protein ACYS30_09080 [Planctomycetota bacterium]|jgi:hypothetical protein
MADSNEQTDADILQCKADILRARDIIPGTPPQEKKTHQEAISQQTVENTTDIEPTHSKEAAPLPAERTNYAETVKQPEPERVTSSIQEAQTEQMKPAKDKAAEAADAGQEKMQIPKFDLAEEIMAEQRKITSIRRKAPGKKIEPPSQEPEVEQGAQLIGYTIGQSMPVLSGQEQIVAEIVARDIEKLCKQGTSGIQG